MAKSKQITLQRLMFLNQRHRQECCGSMEPFCNHKEFVEELIMTEQVLEIDNTNVTKYEPEKWWPEFKLKGVRHDTFTSTDWSGLRKLLPYLGNTRNVPVLMTLVFKEKDVSDYPEEYVIDKYKQPEDYNFHAEDTFWVVSHHYKNWMMSRKDNGIDWEIDDGCIKYDVLDRDDGALVFEYGVLCEFLPDSKSEGDHGSELPFEMKIYIDVQL